MPRCNGPFHNGAFTHIEDAMRHHIEPLKSAPNYNPTAAGVDRDLQIRPGPIYPVLARLDPLLRASVSLSVEEFENLVAFVRDGLLDERARKQNLCRMLPATVPSGLPNMLFDNWPPPR